MDDEEDMSTTAQARKTKAESYAYSWFLPAPGTANPVNAPPAPPPEDPEMQARRAELEAEEFRTEQWRHPARIVSRASRAGFSFNQNVVRIGGVAGWSAVAGTGALILATRANPPPTQLGILAVVWLGVSAAIWFLPGILSRSRK